MRGFPFRTLLLRKKEEKGDEGRWNKELKGIGGVQKFFIKEHLVYYNKKHPNLSFKIPKLIKKFGKNR
ncbi:hypothetical protein [Clostridium beijerinckii]|uniref:hypothetical protein n=1 Tax=Clostridium beijerinckii TaxID=1520 RepID=UPI00047DACF8|nr:hypothetical protein [Clostridium beijerinckii]